MVEVDKWRNWQLLLERRGIYFIEASPLLEFLSSHIHHFVYEITGIRKMGLAVGNRYEKLVNSLCIK